MPLLYIPHLSPKKFADVSLELQIDEKGNAVSKVPALVSHDVIFGKY